MGKIVDADELYAAFRRDIMGGLNYDRILREAKPVDAVPVRYGRWRHYEGMLTCSECGMEFYDDIMEYCGDHVPKFCPNCGAYMRKDGGDGITD